MTTQSLRFAPSAAAMETIGQVPLVFSNWRRLRHVADPIHKDLSAVTRVDDSLFLACDETASVERLQRMPDGRFGEHQHFALDGIVDLPAGAAGEMDIEGLCARDGFLWVVGSHSLKRSKPKRDETGAEEALRRMEHIEREPNRHLLGRIPLEEETPGVFRPARTDSDRQAAWAKFSQGSSALTRWVADDPHLGPFLAIPAKENGFDVEGLAVRGDRVWLGLRGPVLRGHAVVLDLEFREKAPGQLTARRIEDGRRYRKYLVDTRGLGIRDMLWDGDDLLLLIGPTMSLEGPAFVLRWRDAVQDKTSAVIDPDRIEMVAELPYRLHADHPEGIEVWPESGPGGLLVIYDAPGPERMEPDTFTVRADLIGPRTPKASSG